MTLKQLQKCDLDVILSWRNSVVVRKAMFSHHFITKEEHYSWFLKEKKNKSSLHFMWIDPKDTAQGVVSIMCINKSQGTCSWGFYLNPRCRRGMGMYMAIDALDFIFGDLQIEKLSSEVISSNVRSIGFHKKIGFTDEGCFRLQHYDGNQRVDVFRYGMLRVEWSANRARLSSLDWNLKSRLLG